VSGLREIPLARARRIALGALGFARARPTGRVDARHLRAVVDRLSLVQLDSVNVLTRAHHLPFFSRLGAYDRDRLDDLLWRSGEYFEYIGHEAAVLPIETYPLMRHRMDEPRNWRESRRVEARMPGFLDVIVGDIAERGPLTVGELEEGGDRSGTWWGVSPGRWALYALHASGRVAVAERTSNFVTRWDVPERVIPAEWRDAHAVTEHDATVELVRRALRAYGVATVADIADYHRQLQAPVKAALRELEEEGEVEQVRVVGWKEPAYLAAGVGVPRRVDARALVSPFDPLVWFRPRVERLFDFHYRIEIYVPEPKRVFGYYVLPFLLGDRLVGRVDLKADRADRVLRVRAAHHEEHADTGVVAAALAPELRDMAAWLGLDDVSVEPRGGLAPELAIALA
jgi:uncharacterized protein